MREGMEWSASNNVFVLSAGAKLLKCRVSIDKEK
jgi:hypothetical protein